MSGTKRIGERSARNIQYHEFLLPVKIVFGVNSVEHLGSIIRRNTKRNKALIICDGSQWISPTIGRIKESLEKAAVSLVQVYSDIAVNPSIHDCTTALESISQVVPIIIAVGGGSVLDASKWIARKIQPDLFITVPTTAGTGSELNGWAVITDDKTRVKESIYCLPADIAVLDPTVTVSMSASVTLYTGMDAFSHGMEAYVSKMANPLTDFLSLEGCRKIVDNMETCLQDGGNIGARSNMLEASMYAGIAMSNAGLGVLHCISNVLPGIYPSCSHGFVCGALLSKTLAFNHNAIPPEKYRAILPFVEKADRIFEGFISSNHIKPGVIEKKRLEEIITAASGNINRFTNPKRVSRQGIAGLIGRTFPVL